MYVMIIILLRVWFFVNLMEIIKVDRTYKIIPNSIIVKLLIIANTILLLQIKNQEENLLPDFLLLIILLFVFYTFYRIEFIGAGDYKLIAVSFITFFPFKNTGILNLNDGFGFLLIFILFEWVSFLFRAIINLRKLNEIMVENNDLGSVKLVDRLILYSTCSLVKLEETENNDYYRIRFKFRGYKLLLPFTLAANFRLYGWYYGIYPLSGHVAAILLINLLI